MINKKDDVALSFLPYEKEFRLCEATIKNHSKSFYRAFSQLPKEKAWSVFAIYAFCREADDSIDVYGDPERLRNLEIELTAFLAGSIPDRYFWRALVPVFKEYPMNQQAFYDMLSGQRMDLDFQQPQTQKELEEYAYYVAGSVGLMLLPILTNQPVQQQEQGIQLGQAMQITNILRDIGEDCRNHRVYLPQELMETYHVSLEMLQNEQPTPAFIALWEEEAKRAETLYQESMTMLAAIDASCQEALLMAATFYRGILDAVRANHYDCFGQKNYVKKSDQLKLYQAVKNQMKSSSKINR